MRPAPDPRREGRAQHEERTESQAGSEPVGSLNDAVEGDVKSLFELRDRLSEAERREGDLLGAVNVNREEIARLRTSLSAVEARLAIQRKARPDGGTGPAPNRGVPPAIEVRHLSKAFDLPINRPETLKDRVVHPRRSHRAERLQALDDVSFDVGCGEFLGVAGPNGSGKSTLLKILASIYSQDSGTVMAAGRIAPFIELGAGLNPELGAYDNVIMTGVLMGLEPAVARARFDEIISFAGLEPFTEMKLKNYSSGMTVRLAFSVMAQVDADILLVDEVLAVGDAEFQEKCLDRLHALRSAGTTIVLVSHGMEELIEHCDRALLLERGRLLLDEDPRVVAAAYNTASR